MKIFEHIRCDRLIFAGKLVISEKSDYQELLDISSHVIWEDYDKIIIKIKEVLDNFEKYNYKKNFSKIIENRKNILKYSLSKMLQS